MFIIVINNNNELASVFYLGSLIDIDWDWQRGWHQTKVIPAVQSISMSSNFFTLSIIISPKIEFYMLHAEI